MCIRDRGIGFAIPVNMVKIVVAAAKGGGKQVRRPWLGATMQNLTKDIADTMGLERLSGALVTELVAKSPAAEAGLKRGDLITAIDGQSIDAVSYTHLDVYKRQAREGSPSAVPRISSASHSLLTKPYGCLLYTSRCV